MDDYRTKIEPEEDDCTCVRDAEFIAEHTCPYAADVGNDPDASCKCCAYCTTQCALDI